MTSVPSSELRDRIAEALMRWAEGNNNPSHAAFRRPETVTRNAYGRADAVLGVVQSELDRLREQHRRDLLASEESGRILQRQIDAQAAELDLLRAGAVEREALLAEARDALEAAGQNSAHGDDWPAVAPAIRALAVDRDRLRVELEQARRQTADAERMRDFHARSAEHIARKRDRAEQLITRWREGGIAAEAILTLISSTLAVGNPHEGPTIQPSV